MQNRIISLVIALSLALSLAIPVGAANITEAENELASLDLTTGTSVALQRVSQGKYSLVTTQTAQAQAQSGAVVYAKSLHDGEMLQLSDNTYLGKAEGTNYIQLDRIDVDVKNFDREDPVFEAYDISETALDNIQESIAYAEENDNDELEISLYAISPNLTEYVTVNGNNYRNTYEEIRNASFKPISTSGATAKDKLQAAKTFALTVFSVFDGPIGFVTTGISLFDYYLAQTNATVVKGTLDDWSYTTMFYDKLVKHTAVSKNSAWMEGCVSQKLWINKAAVWAYFRSSGQQDNKVDSSINKTKYTKNWDTCYNVTLYNWATGAIKDANPQMRYDGVTWIFK